MHVSAFANGWRIFISGKVEKECFAHCKVVFSNHEILKCCIVFLTSL